MQPGPRNLITDIAGLRVGHAHDAALSSGTTVLTAAAPFTASCAVMGGAPGTRDTELLAPDKLVGGVDALVLSGGSAFGLAACDGVAARLRAAGRGMDFGGVTVPIVPGAILFDLMNGGRKDWAESPYPALGAAAYDAAAEDFDLGSVGAGFGATTADVRGGLGSASAVLAGGVTVGALVAVNPVGSPLVPGGGHFWAAPWEQGEEFGGRGAARDYPTGPGPTKVSPGENTTIAIVATDARLDKAGCQRLAIAAHDGIARAIVPAHTPFDGDLVFAVSAGDREVDPVGLMQVGHAAATCLARAIARAVFHAAPGAAQPSWQERFGAAGGGR
ncbi:P1 family peptidase [Pseudoroseicyclus tamaricis]|uniref:P1 family peptidase n=1 Tax=Pseudoroseicyclus tamaricis TaxID=2705421 RepID=A0A6B2JWP3_9RHOB|nr:P1 family peptidase [Pseudoroseicyclus tamaricis]NDV02325.1 P1 family peptidase [Pseudoroseicyclus tamaricis]